MPTEAMMSKPLDGAGLAVVNQVFNQRLGQMAAAPGKSAYQYAVDGGYSGTEAQFQALMGTGPWLSLGGGALTGAVTVQAPAAGMNPATKQYVDDLVGEVESLLSAV